MISGNNVKLFPIESNDENFLMVYSTIRTITSEESQIPRRSISIDMPVALKTKLNNIKTIQVNTSSLPETKALPIATTDGNNINLRYIGVNDTNFMRILSLYDPQSGGTGIFFDLETSVKTKLNSVQQNIQKESTSRPNLIYPVEILPNSTTVFPLNAITNDNIIVTLAKPLLEGYGRSIEIDLSTTVRDKLSNFKTIQLEPGATLAKKYPAVISGTTVNILPIQSK
jgi:hypothetical protein